MPNRTLCEVFEEMRKCVETRNFSYLLGLIEEAQTLANRMEAALWDQKELKNIRDKIRDAKDKLKELKHEIDSTDSTKAFIDSLKNK